MTLNHSKTWPVSTLAVVQLRVDPHGRTYSTLTPSSEDNNTQNYYKNIEICNEKNNSECEFRGVSENDNNCGGIVFPLSKKHLELFTKMSGGGGGGGGRTMASSSALRTTIRTDTVSTILDQDIEFEEEEEEELELERPDEQEAPSTNGTAILTTTSSSAIEKFHVLALTRIDETLLSESESSHQQLQLQLQQNFHAPGRRPSIKVDNWDFIYTETRPALALTLEHQQQQQQQQQRCPIHHNNSNGTTASTAKDVQDLPLDARKTTTLRRHYYLEGGWGWIVVVCAVLVHVLNHGVQLSCSQLVVPGAEKFKVEAVHFAGISVLIYLALIMVALNGSEQSDVSTQLENLAYLFFHVFVCVASTISYLMYPKRIDHFLASFSTMQRIDSHLHSLGYTSLSFRHSHFFVRIILNMFFLAPISTVHSTFFVKRNFYFQWGENISYGLPFTLMALPVAYWIALHFTIVNRIGVLNDYVECLVRDRARRTKVFMRQRIIFVSELHQMICQASNNVTYSLAPVILTFYVGCGVFMTLSLLMLLNIGMAGFKIEIYFWTCVFIVSTNTTIILYEIANYRKNTLLLQLLHQQINLNVCGFELNLSKMLETIGNVTSIGMFLLQFKSATKTDK